MNKKLVIIGANDFQNQLILKAKEMGYETHVFAWEAGDPGERTADYFYPVSIIEKREILNICRGINPDGVVSVASDLAVPTVNYVASGLGLTCNSAASSELGTNKFKMRKALCEKGCCCPKFTVANLAGLANGIDLAGFAFPLIVKPTDRSGSRGVTRVDAAADIPEAVECAVSHSFEKRAMIEEFMSGEEFSVECMSWNGAHSFLALTKKYTTGAPGFVESGHLQPAKVDAALLDKIRPVVFDALDALKMQNGASHAEIMVTPDTNKTVKIVEVGLRMGGDCIGSDLIRLSRGIDFLGLVIDVAVGRPPLIQSTQSPMHTYIHFVFGKSDLERIALTGEKYPGVVHRMSEIKPFDRSSVADSSERYGYCIFAHDCEKVIDDVIKICRGESPMR